MARSSFGVASLKLADEKLQKRSKDQIPLSPSIVIRDQPQSSIIISDEPMHRRPEMGMLAASPLTVYYMTFFPNLTRSLVSSSHLNRTEDRGAPRMLVPRKGHGLIFMI